MCSHKHDGLIIMIRGQWSSFNHSTHNKDW